MTCDRRYWDSDCFLGWLKGDVDKVDSCRQVLNKAAAGEIEIVTSALTIAEVLKLKGRDPIHADKRNQVVDFFNLSYIVPVSITRRIAENSRYLVWDHGISPKDALHVATAIHAKVDLFNTFDKVLLKNSEIVGDPLLKIEKPDGS